MVINVRKVLMNVSFISPFRFELKHLRYWFWCWEKNAEPKRVFGIEFSKGRDEAI